MWANSVERITQKGFIAKKGENCTRGHEEIFFLGNLGVGREEVLAAFGRGKGGVGA